MPYPKLPATKRLQVKSGTTQAFYVYYGDNTISIPAAPTGVTYTDATPSAGWLRIQVNGNTASDSGAHDFTAFDLYIDVVALSSSVETVSTCCDTNTLYVTWFNQIGGWQSWAFRRKRTFTIEIGDQAAQSYVTGLTKRYSNMGDVYEGEIVTYELTSKTQIDQVSTLKYSIQAYVYNDTTTEFDIPILIERENFTKYTNGLRDKVFQFTFKFIYAEKKSIQTQ